jgi:hypothetical protein
MALGTPPQLRPLGVGELLDQAIRLYRRNFLKFIGIIAIVQIPLSLLQMVTSLVTVTGVNTLDPTVTDPASPFELFTPTYFIGLLGTIVVGVISIILIQGVATAALTRAVAGSYLGESLGIIESYQKIGQAWLPMIGALILAFIVGIGLVIWLLIPCVGWLTGFGMLAFFWLVLVPLIAPTVVLERQPWTVAIRRAWDLARRRFWWVLGFVLVLFIFSQLVITGPVTLISLVFQMVSGGPLQMSMTENVIQVVLQSLVGMIFGVVYWPLQLTAITLMYFDLRIRTEAFDLTVLTSNLTPEQQGEITDLTTQAPAPDRGNLITLNELGYFVIVSIGAFGLYLLVIFIFGLLGILILGASGGLS